MRNKRNQRLLALLLSIVLILGANISAMAGEEMQAAADEAQMQEAGAETEELAENPEEMPAVQQETESTPEPSVQSVETTTEFRSGENEEQTEAVISGSQEQEDPEETAEASVNREENIPETETEETEPEAAEPLEKEPETAAGEQEAEGTENTETERAEPSFNKDSQEQTVQNQQDNTENEGEETILSQETELKQEFKDEEGNVVRTVTAYIPEGAFPVSADQLSMEVTPLDQEQEAYIKGMIEDQIPENNYLDGYVLYQIDFKADGEITEPAKAITISMTGDGLAVEDTRNAHVFYYVPEDPETDGDEDSLAEVIQKDQLVRSLEEAGESTEQIEDHDYSEITVKEGIAETISVKGWKSTIYGCYTEKEAVTELNYEDDSVRITVSADQPGIIPNGAELSVTPIRETEIRDGMSKEEKARAEEINAQYKLTEEKLQEDSKDNELMMEGFLAYDISFLTDGEEVEPDGDVRVFMEFKEAALPDGVSENAEAAVKHLKEEKDAEDGVIVEDMTEKSQVQTTDKAEVEAVTLTSDNFSTFMITWTREPYSITVHYVNEKYQEITGEDVQREDVPLENPEKPEDSKEIDLSEYRAEIEGYDYLEAHIGQPETENGETESDGKEAGPVVSRIRVENGTLQYCNCSDESEEWKVWKESLGYQVYLVYKTQENKAEGPDEEAVIETINNAEENIQLNLFNYKVSDDGDEYSWCPKDSSVDVNAGDDIDKEVNHFNDGINKDKPFKFMHDTHYITSETGNIPLWTINRWTDGIDVRKGIVKNELGEDGYPVLDYDDSSLGYLFSVEESNDYKDVYAGANYLFTKDENGYVQFDSDKNYAQFDTKSKDFTVYSNPYSEYTSGKEGLGLKGFYPFDDFEKVRNIYLKTGGAAFGASASRSWGLPRNQADHYFGMTMSATFYQPEDGRINENDMVFEFSGDDDVWVFIDGKLVLDMGGIHDQASGSINFATGEVTVNDKTVSQMYPVGNGTPSIFEKKFEDYSTHTINFFYLERGNNVSNCKLNFNLPTIPKDSVMVAKQVTADDVSDATLENAKKVDFHFVIEKYDTDKNEYMPLADEKYEIRDENNKKIGTGTTEKNGEFTLKHGQSALFADLFKVTDRYRVKEIGASLEEGYLVSVNVDIKNDEGEIEDTLESVSTEDLVVGQNPSVVFKNKIKDTADLKIKKVVADNDKSDLEGQSFGISVWINGELYRGEYKIEDKTCQAEGGIIYLEDKQTALITGIPYGSVFEVKEVDGKGCTPEYKVENIDKATQTLAGGGESADSGAAEEKAFGVVSGDCEVTVTNTLPSLWRAVKVSAASTPGTQQTNLGGAQFTATTSNTEGQITYYGESQEKTGVIIWYNNAEFSEENDGKLGEMLPDGTYTIKETKAPDGCILDTTGWSLTVEDGNVTIKHGGSEVKGIVKTETDVDGNISKITEFYLKNEILYELPSTGGPGIFLYMIGGTLLLMAGSLMIYINKRRGVLRR